MKVRDLMARTVASCRPETNLAAAGALMWESDCGVLPVIDERNRVTGILTDRDACIALTTRDQRASAISVGEVVTGRAFVCEPDDDVRVALKIMRSKRIHRLPVVNKTGMLEGIISLNDIISRAGKGTLGKDPGISYEDVAETLHAICAPGAGRNQGSDSGKVAA